MIGGIDISAVQGAITPAHWQAIAARGTRFAVCRCGVGNDPPDVDFARNIAAARDAGLVVGCYHFVYPLPDAEGHVGRDPVTQARSHYQACGGLGAHAGELPPAIDCEWPAPQDFARWGVTAATIRSWLAIYLAEAERLYGVTPLVYTYPDWAAHVALTPDFARYPLWAAEYGPTHPIAPWASCALVQTSGGGGRLPDGQPVDTDECADEITFAALLGRIPGPPPTVPVPPEP